MVDQTRFLAVAEEAVEHLTRLKETYPELATTQVHAVIEKWGRSSVKAGINAGAPADIQSEEQALALAAYELIESHQVEDVMGILSREFGAEIDYQQLIEIIGKDRYRKALCREAVELQQNAISPEQTADLWNSMGKPALGDNRWTARGVSMLSE